MRGMSARTLMRATIGIILLALLLASIVGRAYWTQRQERCLSWRPPELVEPEVIQVLPGSSRLVLEDDRDYILELPDVPVTLDGGLFVEGGRNVVLIGGDIRVPDAQSATEPARRRGILLKDQTGVVHIEGVRLAGDDLAEGIALEQPEGATVQLQAIEVAPVHGSFETNHADVLQTWWGPRSLRVDLLRGATDYQGFFLMPNEFGPTNVDEVTLRRVGIEALAGSRYILWTQQEAPWLSVDDVWVETPDGSDSQRLHPATGVWDDVQFAEVGDSGLAWPQGVEPGVEYVSPGYC